MEFRLDGDGSWDMTEVKGNKMVEESIDYRPR
jgi:hypothetical protein